MTGDPGIVAAGLAAALMLAPFRPDDAGPVASSATVKAQQSEKRVTKAPPLNQRFATLDDYLAFRAKGAAIDKSWYREIRPGVYRLEKGLYRGPDTEQTIFTRAELMKKYGFNR